MAIRRIICSRIESRIATLLHCPIRSLFRIVGAPSSIDGGLE